jgi:hypothetical protein
MKSDIPFRPNLIDITLDVSLLFFPSLSAIARSIAPSECGLQHVSPIPCTNTTKFLLPLFLLPASSSPLALATTRTTNNENNENKSSNGRGERRIRDDDDDDKDDKDRGI